MREKLRKLMKRLNCFCLAFLALYQLQHDWVGEEPLNVIEAPACPFGFKHGKDVIHKRHDRRFMQSHPHGDIDAVIGCLNGLHERPKALGIRQNDKRFVEVL